MSVLAERLLALHASLSQARLPHAFGGAIALAYCTEEPRGTRDIDLNVFVKTTKAALVLGALPESVGYSDDDLSAIEADGQVRLLWGDTPIDLFFDTHAFHARAAARVRRVPFEDQEIPVLDCTSLVVFKALFGRSRDWADIEEIKDAGALDRTDALKHLEELVGPNHASTRALRKLGDLGQRGD